MLLRIGKVLLGVAMIVAGSVLGVLPFLPGWPLILIGVGLILAQSAPGRRVTSRIRLAARDRFGSDRVRGVERRLPKEVVPPHDTIKMRLDLEEYTRERQKRQRRQNKGRRKR